MTLSATGVDAIVAAIAAEGDRRSLGIVPLADRLGIGGVVARRVGAVMNVEESTSRRLRDQLLREAATELAAALDRAGIVHFFARGAALRHLYALGDRDAADIDVYVGPEAALRAQARLQAMGYRLAARADQSGPDALRCTVALVREGTSPSRLDEAHVDLHWGIEPVDRLLPRPDVPVPTRVWARLQRIDGLSVPTPAHHAAMIVHHLVHHDFLHVRGLLDLVRLRESTWRTDEEFMRLAEELGVYRVALVLHETLERHCGLDPVAGVRAPDDDWRTAKLRAITALGNWIRLALDATPRQHAAITRARVARRVVSLDRFGAVHHLIRDALFPPTAHLVWRWPDATSTPSAWLRHLRLLAGSAMGR